MKRNKPTSKPDAIITADMHLTTRVPVSRTDDYLQAQLKKLQFVKQLQEQYSCIVLDGGDLFDHWKAPPWLSALAYEHLPSMVTIPGNHDLPEHSLEKYDKSALHLLEETRHDIDVLHEPNTPEAKFDQFHIYGYPNGLFELRAQYQERKGQHGRRNVLLMHEFVWSGLQPPFPNAPGYMAQSVLRRLFRHFDLIICGDNHTAFTESYEKTILVNPGSMMRMTADTMDYKPRCYLYYAKTNTVRPVYYPIQEGVHSTEHLDIVKDRDARIAAYIQHMDTQWEHGLSFKHNLEEFFQTNKTPKLVKELIWEHLEMRKE